ncbi:MAG: ATP-binding protein [Geminicoccaceae bacterium]
MLFCMFRRRAARVGVFGLAAGLALLGAIAGLGLSRLVPASAFTQASTAGDVLVALTCVLPVIAALFAVRIIVAGEVARLERSAEADGDEDPPARSRSFPDEFGRIADAWRAHAARLHAETATSLRRHETLSRDLERAVRRNAELIEFVYTASHDLKGTNNTTSALLGIVLEEHALQLPRAAIEHISSSLSLLERTRTLVIDITAYLTCLGSTETVRQTVDLAEIAASAREEYLERMQWAEVSIHVGDLPKVEGHPGSVRTLFRCLCDNALKFCDSERRQLTISCESSPGCHLVHFQDNGVGIAPEFIDRIFAPFARLHTYEEYPGSGLGLARCRCIAERHGWTIGVESEPGKGSIFTLRIPVEPPAATCPLVMLLDDDRFDRMVIARAINRISPSVEIVEFSLAEDLLADLETREPIPGLVILIDINLPKVDGFDLIDRLFERFADRFDGLCIAIVSNCLAPQLRLRAANDPRIAYCFDKPVTADDLESVLARRRGGVMDESDG